jgi:hypothetical protein
LAFFASFIRCIEIAVATFATRNGKYHITKMKKYYKLTRLFIEILYVCITVWVLAAQQRNNDLGNTLWITIIMLSYLVYKGADLLLLFFGSKYSTILPQSNPFTRGSSSTELSQGNTQVENYSMRTLQSSIISTNLKTDICHTRSQYLKELADGKAEKLKRTIQYTSKTFTRLGFDKQEVDYICTCVELFVTRQQFYSFSGQTLHRHKGVTQIAIKNFAWNIGKQYNILGLPLARFVYYTFHEWFINSSIQSIYKTLRTTQGAHAIEIDEHILDEF